MSRLEAFGNQLIEHHLYLRELLDNLRTQAEPNPSAARDLRTHCLTFCKALTSHHTGEDEGAFPVIAEHYPELRPVLAELTRDHHLIAEALQRLETLHELNPADRQRELDTLAALLETHFTYEEKKLLDAFNALTGDPSTTERLSRPFRRTGG